MLLRQKRVLAKVLNISFHLVRLIRDFGHKSEDCTQEQWGFVTKRFKKFKIIFDGLPRYRKERRKTKKDEITFSFGG